MNDTSAIAQGMEGVGAPSPKGRLVCVQSCEYDARVRREWRANLIKREGDLIVLEGVFELEVRHKILGVIRRGTRSTEFYWTDRWYSVFRFHEPDTDALRNFYCNINMPPAFDGETLRFVDLDVDALVTPDYQVKILDEDEFQANAARFGYTEEIRSQVARALAELNRLIEERAFPFKLPDEFSTAQKFKSET